MMAQDCGPAVKRANRPGGQLRGMPSWAHEMPNCRYQPSNVEPAEIPIEAASFTGAKFFLAYWHGLRAERFAPSWTELDLMALGGKSAARAIVVDILTAPLRIKYRFWGTANTNAKGLDMTGKHLDDFPLVRQSVAREEYKRVISERRPVAFKDKLVLPETGHSVLRFKAAFDQVMVRLPLSSDGETVDHIVSLANWERNPSV